MSRQNSNSASKSLPVAPPSSLRGRLLVRVDGLALAALLALGCGQDPMNNQPVTFSELRPLLKTSCALSSSCHAVAATGSGNLSLAEADAYCSLVGATQGATYRSTAKSQYPRRLVPGDKDGSFLYQKLTLAPADSGPTKPLGAVMPLYQPLDAANIELFARWIDGGAQNDSGAPAPTGCN